MLLSVIVPVHNTGKYLESCVDSIYQQGLKHNDFEIILVNNASVDNSLEICRILKDRYQNILLIHTDTPGVSNARNLGMKRAQGEYIHFVDSDDCLLTGMYRAYNKTVEKGKMDIIVSGIDNYYETENKHIIQKPTKSSVLKDKEEVCNRIRSMTPDDKIWLMNVVWNKWYKREVLIKMKAEFDTTLRVGEDFVFNCRLYAELQSCAIVSQAYYLYFHRNAQSALNQFHHGELERRRRMIEEHKALYHKLGINNKDKEIEILNGELLFRHLYSVFRSDCKINKKAYIKTVIEDALFQDVYYFFDSRPNNYYRVLKFMAKYKSYGGFYYILKVKYILSVQGKAFNHDKE